MGFIKNITYRDGTSQKQRFPEALDPGYAKIDDRDTSDWLQFTRKLSELIIYYNTNNQPDGNWNSFFPDESEIEEIANYLQKLEKYKIAKKEGDTNAQPPEKKEFKPHLALFITFLQLLKFVKSDLNTLTKRHLDYYYREILKFKLKPAQPDKVHVLFELSKHEKAYKLDAGSKLIAGKDKNGKQILYETTKDIVINKATVESIKSIYIDKEGNYKIYASPYSNSSDGKGSPFNEENTGWKLFGTSQKDIQDSEKTMSVSETGFALASSMFLLNSGHRTITVNFELVASFGNPSPQVLQNIFKSFASGKKEWISPSSINAEICSEYSPKIITISLPDGTPAELPGNTIPDSIERYSEPDEIDVDKNAIKKTEIEIRTYEGTEPSDYLISTSLYVKRNLKIILTFNKELPPIVSFNSSVLNGKFKSRWPILKTTINNEIPNPKYSILKNLKIYRQIIEVSVEGLENLYVQNDQSSLDPSKTILPFGTKPSIGSAFYLGHEEFWRKKIESIKILLKWDNLPDDNLAKYYFAYDDDANQAYSDALDSGNTEEEALDAAIGALTPNANFNSVFTSNLYIFYNKDWLPIIDNEANPESNFEPSLFDTLAISGSNEYPGFRCINIESVKMEKSLSNINYRGNISNNIFNGNINADTSGFFKIEITGPTSPFSAFGHFNFQNKITKVAIDKSVDQESNKALPNPPYTPAIKKILVNYTSSQITEFHEISKNNQFFHIEPFGEYCLDQSTPPFLLPQYNNEGTCFIGLKNFIPPQQISLLFQIEEGSSNPEITLNSQDLTWSYLSNNQWIDLKGSEIISENTKGFQTSGIVELAIGEIDTSGQSRLPEDLHWLKCSLADNVSGANNIFNIHTQAVLAKAELASYSDIESIKENSPVLAPKTITKLKEKHASIKKITQPYASFDGKRKEKDNAFYTRISERLRHRQRAINYWDYERIVLEAFPSLYKVKCLPCFKDNKVYVPGSVLLVVISDLRNKNAVNPLQPKTNSITLINIKEFLKKYVTSHLELQVENPYYDRLFVDLKVAFKQGYDYGYYSEQLNKDLKIFLSPWAYDKGEDIIFGGKISRSDILYFVENLEYVDFITQFDVYHLLDEKTANIEYEGIESSEYVNEDYYLTGIGEMVLEDNFIIGYPVENASAGSPRTILVSAENHRIEILKPGDVRCPRGIQIFGIGYMHVGFDFIVGSYRNRIGNMAIVNYSRGGDPDLYSRETQDGELEVSSEEDLANSPENSE